MGAWTGTDQEAEKIFQEFYEKEYEKLVRCAISYIKAGNSRPNVLNRAEDVVQEMFAVAWKRRTNVLSSEKPVGWLYVALHYKTKELLKEENKWLKQLLQYEILYEQSEETCDNAEKGPELESLVSKEDFDLLYKFYVEGYSYRELCEERGLTKSALGVRIHRIKHRIQEKIKE